MKYYAKSVPRTPIFLSTGKKLEFDRVNAAIGIFATENQFLLGQLETCIKFQRGGVREIDQAEYESLLAKKEKPASFGRRSPWREEVGAGKMPDTVTASVKPRAGVVVDRGDKVPTVMAGPVNPTTPAEPIKPIKLEPPKTGQRRTKEPLMPGPVLAEAQAAV